MSLLFIDGFDDGLLYRKYHVYATGQLTSVAGRNGNGIQTAGTTGIQRLLTTAEESATLIIGFAFKMSNTDTRFFLTLGADNGQTEHVSLYYTGTAIEIRRGGPSGSTALGNSGSSLTANTWYYIELKAVLSDTTGTVELRVNGKTVVNLTSVDTKNAGTKTVFDAIRLFSSWGGVVYDDFYVCNDAGVAPYNTFLGDLAIETLVPTGNGANSGLVGSDGNSVDNYLLVDDPGAPDTADYVGSSTDAAKDTYAFSNLARTTGNVLGVQVAGYMQKSDTGARSMRHVARLGTTDYGGADHALAQSWETKLQMWANDPTGAAWTIANVNAAEFGVEVRP